jgi:hypothetical protein
MPYTSIQINGTRILLTISNPKKTVKWGNEMDAWNVLVTNKETESFETFKYYTGIGHRKIKGKLSSAKFDPQSFLYCIFSDASMIDQYEDDVDSFADDLGYTKVSEALKAFRGCTEIRQKLGTLFGEEYSNFSDFILENYG